MFQRVQPREMYRVGSGTGSVASYDSGYGSIKAPPSPLQSQPYSREQCDSVFSTYNASSAHKIYTCLHPGCGSCFTRSFSLARHVKLHSQAAIHRFDCPGRGCGRQGTYGFTRKDHLQEHLRAVHLWTGYNLRSMAPPVVRKPTTFLLHSRRLVEPAERLKELSMQIGEQFRIPTDPEDYADHHTAIQKVRHI